MHRACGTRARKRRRRARLALEEAREVAGVREPELVADVLDAERRVGQLTLRLEADARVQHGERRVAEHGAADAVQLRGRDADLAGQLAERGLLAETLVCFVTEFGLGMVGESL